MIDLEVGLALGIGKLTESIDQLVRRLGLTHSPLIRKYGPLSYTAAAAQPTYGFLDLGGPLAGQLWDVRRIVVMGQDPFSSVTGSVFPFITTAQPTDTSTEPQSFGHIVNVPTAAIPNVDTWGKGQVMLVGSHSESLFLCLKSLGNNQTVVAYLEVMQINESDLGTLENQ